MKLMIIESSGKISTLKKILPDFEIIATGGHFKKMELLTDEDVAKHKINFYNVWEKVSATNDFKQANIDKIKTLAETAETIFIATDGDREGEAIAFHVLDEIPSKYRRKVKRVIFNEITKREVLEKINHPTTLNPAIYAAQQARAVQDQLIGFKLTSLSRNLTRNKNLSIGRVQSIALLLIALSQKSPSWKTPHTLKVVDSDLILDDIPELTYTNDDELNKIKQSFKKPVNFKVQEITSTRVFKKPLNTYDFLKNCAKKYPTYSLEEIAKICQKIYEKGGITYPRTDSRKISANWIEDNKVLISKFSFFEVNPQLKKELTNEDQLTLNSQGAHEALRVTDFKVPAGLNEFETEIYQMLKQATINYFVPELSYSIKLAGENETLPTITVKTPNPLVAIGFKKSRSVPLKMSLEPIISTDGITKEGLITLLEQNGIGRPATIAKIIEINSLKGNTIQNPQNKLELTKQGEIIKEFILKNLTPFINIEYTKNIEEKLDAVANSEFDAWKLIEEINQKINLLQKDVKEKTLPIKEETSISDTSLNVLERIVNGEITKKTF